MIGREIECVEVVCMCGVWRLCRGWRECVCVCVCSVWRVRQEGGVGCVVLGV